MAIRHTMLFHSSTQNSLNFQKKHGNLNPNKLFIETEVEGSPLIKVMAKKEIYILELGF
jgi:hypothetical protein